MRKLFALLAALAVALLSISAHAAADPRECEVCIEVSFCLACFEVMHGQLSLKWDGDAKYSTRD